jgi:hypothetical protein
VSALVLPAALLDEAGLFFEDRGSWGLEGTAMIKDGPRGPMLVIPDQDARRSPTGGVSVTLTSVGQMELALALAADELFVARIHSHPGDAFHSPTDDANPVLVHEGALSIVVPYFGLGLRQGLSACAVFQRRAGRWDELPDGSDRVMWLRTSDEES